MTLFHYEALRPPEEEIRGVIEAESLQEALTKLKAKGLIPLEVSSQKEKGPIFNKKTSVTDLSLLLHQLAILTKSGLPLTQALGILAKRQRQSSLATELEIVRERLEKGESLPLAFKASGIFPEFFCEMLSGAQTGKNLEDIFLKAAEFVGRLEDFKKRLLGALIYPSLVISLSLVAVIIILRFIVPKIREILLGFGKDLPFLTKILIWAAHLTWWVLLGVLPLAILILVFLRRKSGIIRLHRLALQMPVIGRLWFFSDISRWAYVVGLLLESGVSLPSALKVGCRSMTNLFLRERFTKLVKPVEEGEALYRALKSLEVPLLLRDLIATGEESGDLSEMLKSCSAIYWRESDHLIEKTLKLVEPVTILIIGLVVAYIVVSVILPIMEISSAVKT